MAEAKNIESEKERPVLGEKLTKKKKEGTRLYNLDMGKLKIQN